MFTIIKIILDIRTSITVYFSESCFLSTDINHCASHGCSNGATCVDGVTEYTCNCLAGYEGTFCETG